MYDCIHVSIDGSTAITESQGESLAISVEDGSDNTLHIPPTKARVGDVKFPIIRNRPGLITQAATTAGMQMLNRFYCDAGTGEILSEHIFGDRWPEDEVILDMLRRSISSGPARESNRPCQQYRYIDCSNNPIGRTTE